MRAAAPLLLLAARGAAAAGPRCFVDAAWPASDVIVNRSIAFGSAWNNMTGQQETLLLDAYFPPATDARDRRPAMVLLHGGGFIMGNRSCDDSTCAVTPMPDLAYALARRGFVVVSAEYRLTGAYWGKGDGCFAGGFGIPPCENTARAALDAEDDGRAAVRFVRRMAQKWRIDSGRVGVAGSSAGAITAEWMGYVAGDGGDDSSAVSVVAPISGALRYMFWCMSFNGTDPVGCQLGARGSGWDHVDDITGKGQPALCQVHGTQDLIVPYVNALANKARADAVGLPNSLVTLDGAGHVPIVELLGNASHHDALDAFTTCIASGMDLGDAQCPQPR